MKVLVTGGAGFIGSHIVELLLKEGYTPIVVDNLSTGNKAFLPPNTTFYEMDVLAPRIAEVFEQERPDYVIHQAAQVDVAKSIEDPTKDGENNILTTIHLLQLSQKYSVKRFIFASSCSIYGETGDTSTTEHFPIQPLSFYGLSKSTSEMYIKMFYNIYRLPYTILRYANVYGPRQTPKGEGGVIAIFIKKLLNQEHPTIYGDGNQTRDFIYVKDVALANIQALKQQHDGIYNIGRDSKLSINELYQLALQLTNQNITPLYSPTRKGDIKFSRLNIKKAENELKWCPKYSMEDGLKETIQYYLR